MSTSLRFDAEVIRETANALIAYLNGDGIEHPIPKSQILTGSQIHHAGDSGSLIVSDWFARNARLPQGEIIQMPFEPRPGQTNLFSNRDKKNEKHPDYKGECTVEIDGKLHTLEVALRRKDGTKAGEYFDLRFKQSRSGDSRHRFNEKVAQLGTDLDAAFPGSRRLE